MSTPQFVDVSSFQENIDFAAYAAWSREGDGIARIAIKATEGIGFIDPSFPANRAGALDAGIEEIYYYHFGRPDIGNDPVAEAKFMHSVVGNVRGSDMLILDYEVSSSLATSAWAYAWLAQQQDSYDGKLPGIYASSAYIAQHLQDSRLARYPLWLANWEFTPNERPPVPAPWSTYEFVQYTDKASIPGIPGTVDADIFLGVEPSPPQEDPMTIDLNTPGVGTFFKATSDPQVWQCIQNSFLVGHGILGFYQKFGGDALCGLTYLGLPKSNELTVTGHPGVTQQVFERGCVRWDPAHVADFPPGAGDVYTVHYEQDPRSIAAQAQITQLENLPVVANFQQIATIGKQISDDVALILKLAQVQ